MDKGLKSKPTAVFYGIVSVVFLVIFAGVQTNAFGTVVAANFNIPPIVIAILYTLLLIVVIFGGAKTIANVADKVVPFMSVLYIGVALVLIIFNIDKVPAMFSLIFSSAFSTNAVFGGIVGSAVSWGVRRGVFSNEAGLGTGTWVAGSSDVSHPAKAGLSQAFSVFISVLICLATALMILVTDSYSVVNSDGGFIVEYISGSYDIFAVAAVDSLVNGFGTIFITIAMFLFTFTTIMAYSMYLSRIYYYFFGSRIHEKRVKLVNIGINIATVVVSFFGPLINPTTIWSLASALCGLLSLVNLASLVLMYKPAVATLRDYERQLKVGIDPVFIPENCNIDNADLWHQIIAEDYADELKVYNKTFPKGRA